MANEVNRLSLEGLVDSGWIGHIQDWIALVSESHSGIDAWQKSA
jgi:hypothetical protein